MEDRINNRTEDIKAVQKRPGMYIGSTSRRGLHRMLYEIVYNATAEAMAGFCRKITVTLHKDDSCTVSDDGRGIPVGIDEDTGKTNLETVFTHIKVGEKIGMGATVVNALSQWLAVTSFSGGKKCTLYFEKGALVRPYTEEKDETASHGLTVTFKPDPEIFEDVEFNHETVLARLKELAFLNAGLEIELIDERREKSFCYEDGICSFVRQLVKETQAEPLHPAIFHVKGQKEDITFEAAFQYVDAGKEKIVSFLNNAKTDDGGDHETGFVSALTAALNAEAEKDELFYKGAALKEDDTVTGLCAVISVKTPITQFDWPQRALKNREVQVFSKKLIPEKLTEYFEEHPDDRDAILKKVLMAMNERISFFQRIEEGRQKAAEAARDDKK